MNIAPYILAKSLSLHIPDEVVPSHIREHLNLHWKFFESFGIQTAIIRNIDIENLNQRRSLTVGLISLPTESWSAMTSGFKRVQQDSSRPERFVCGIHLKEPDTVLLFPDDSLDTLNISVFYPVLNSESEIILYSLTLSTDNDFSKILGIEAGPKTHCTLSVKGVLPNRVFSCSRTGCDKECKSVRLIEKGRVTTLRCDC